MIKRIFWLGALLVLSPLRADETASPGVQTSTAFLTPAASTATLPAPPVASTTTLPGLSAAPAVAPTPVALPGVMPRAPRSFLNEMAGTVLAMDADAGSIRITVEGGFNVDFSYDNTTVVTEDSKPLASAELTYGDKVVIHYAGRDLVARQIERTAKAPTDLH